jgi:hypothetical protein
MWAGTMCSQAKQSCLAEDGDCRTHAVLASTASSTVVPFRHASGPVKGGTELKGVDEFVDGRCSPDAQHPPWWRRPNPQTDSLPSMPTFRAH